MMTNLLGSKAVSLRTTYNLARLLLGGTLVAALVACGGGGGSYSSAPTAAPPPAVATPTPPPATDYPLLGKVTILGIDSKLTGATYPINVYTPANYVAGGTPLPIIYATDGGSDSYPNFQVMATILEQQGVRAIMVGIGNYARRETDYRLPGAPNFYAFITQELIPFIEPKYSVDPKARTLSGHSYGGLFALLAMTMDRPANAYFRNFSAMDGAFSYQNNWLNERETQMFVASAGKLPNTTLVLSSATIAGFDTIVESTYQRLLARNYENFSLNRISGYMMGHDEMFIPAFRDSMRLLFPK